MSKDRRNLSRKARKRTTTFEARTPHAKVIIDLFVSYAITLFSCFTKVLQVIGRIVIFGPFCK